MNRSFGKGGRAAAIAASGLAVLLAAPAVAADPFRAAPSIAAPTSAERSRSWAGDAEIGPATLALLGTRRKSIPVIDPLSIAPRERVSVWEGAARAALDISSRDIVGVSAAAMMERRRPSGLASHGGGMGSRAMAVMLEWARSDRMRLSAGWFASGPRGGRLPGDRVSERGGGALPDARGVRLAMDLLDGDGAWIGFDARVQRVSAIDAGLAGRNSATRDARAGVTFRTRF